jgi:hypothetical protein
MDNISAILVSATRNRPSVITFLLTFSIKAGSVCAVMIASVVDIDAECWHSDNLPDLASKNFTIFMLMLMIVYAPVAAFVLYFVVMMFVGGVAIFFTILTLGLCPCWKIVEKYGRKDKNVLKFGLVLGFVGYCLSGVIIQLIIYLSAARDQGAVLIAVGMNSMSSMLPLLQRMWRTICDFFETCTPTLPKCVIPDLPTSIPYSLLDSDHQDMIQSPPHQESIGFFAEFLLRDPSLFSTAETPIMALVEKMVEKLPARLVAIVEDSRDKKRKFNMNAHEMLRI